MKIRILRSGRASGSSVRMHLQENPATPRTDKHIHICIISYWRDRTSMLRKDYSPPTLGSPSSSELGGLEYVPILSLGKTTIFPGSCTHSYIAFMIRVPLRIHHI